MHGTGVGMVDMEAPPVAPTGRTRRRVERQRGLPGGRAVIGAFLVAAAAVGVFAVHLRATAAPATSYLVASQDIDAGTRIDETNLETLFGHLAIDLAPAVADRSVPLEQREQLVGQVVTAPLVRGDLLSRTAMADEGGVPDDYTMSFPIAAADAVAGELRRGQRVDAVATYGSGEAAVTRFVVVGAPLVAIESADDDGFGGSGQRVLTVALADQQQVQALAHAVAVAHVVVTRSPRGAAGTAPEPFRPPPAAPAGERAPDTPGADR